MARDARLQIKLIPYDNWVTAPCGSAD